ncbi:MAG: anti-sigma factor, partial [Aestuariivirga sp.]
MAKPEDREGLAAEYVLGTLDQRERADAERAMAADAEFATLVSGWERRLIPLALALEPVPAPSHLRSKVMAAISADAADPPIVGVLERRVRRWRGVAIGAFAMAAALAGVIVFRPPHLPEGARDVAV